ncbi:hypothetical protein B9Z55_016591 [Caenorhabditis nigoni]|uniref:Uncharacterized protein n=1 Tax=Caenorhabditis nigoni TaxID=1611254 RepID=A0A2G5T5C7_9PELO|nr:hypothetical protein B9Z55_016591 [Caenorhabditis nigoni]
MKKEREVVRERKGKVLKEKESELRDLEWQCRILETVNNRSTLLLNVSGELVRESEEKKIPQLITMVDELKKKLDQNPYVLDDELTKHEVIILEKISKHSKVSKVTKKLRKWFRVDVLGEKKKSKKSKDKKTAEGPVVKAVSLEPKQQTPKDSEKPPRRPSDLERMRSGSPMKSNNGKNYQLSFSSIFQITGSNVKAKTDTKSQIHGKPSSSGSGGSFQSNKRPCSSQDEHRPTKSYRSSSSKEVEEKVKQKILNIKSEIIID